MVNCESYRFSRRLATKWKMNRSINLNCALFENVYLPLKSICIIQIDINFLVNVTFYGFFIAKHSKGERERKYWFWLRFDAVEAPNSSQLDEFSWHVLSSVDWKVHAHCTSTICTGHGFWHNCYAIIVILENVRCTRSEQNKSRNKLASSSNPNGGIAIKFPSHSTINSFGM